MVLAFLHEDLHVKVAAETIIFWLGVACCFSSNQIEGLFYQKNWKEPVDVFHFLLGDNHQWKVAFKTTTLDRVWPGLPLGQSDFSIFLNHQYLWKESIDTFHHCRSFLFVSLCFLSNVAGVYLVLTCFIGHENTNGLLTFCKDHMYGKNLVLD